MPGDIELIRLIEELTANSWPAYIQQKLGSWTLRANMNVTKRANSVYTSGAFPDCRDWKAIAEEFYRRRSIPPCFYISEASPAALDGILLADGYRKVFECCTMVGACDDVMARAAAADRFTAKIAEEASREWINDFIRLEDYSPERYEGYVHIFSAIGPKKAFISLYEQGRLIALGTAVAERGWAGLSNIIVAEGQRGKGAATALLRALVGWAMDNGAERLYLQVLKDNATALALYQKLGLTPLYDHYYRLLDA